MNYTYFYNGKAIDGNRDIKRFPSEKETAIYYSSSPRIDKIEIQSSRKLAIDALSKDQFNKDKDIMRNIPDDYDSITDAKLIQDINKSLRRVYTNAMEVNYTSIVENHTSIDE